MFENIKKTIERKAIIIFTNELVKKIDTKIDNYYIKRNEAIENKNDHLSTYYNGKISALNEVVFIIIRTKDGVKYER